MAKRQEATPEDLERLERLRAATMDPETSRLTRDATQGGYHEAIGALRQGAAETAGQVAAIVDGEYERQ